MDATAVQPATETDQAPRQSPVVGWEGPLAPLNTVTGQDRRMLRNHSTDVSTRSLPLPLKFQEVSAPAHDNAISGLAMITRVWAQDGYIWGSGPFNMGDPRAAKLANDVYQGFAGWVSIEIDADTYTNEKYSDGRNVKVFSEFTVSGATLVGDPAFDKVRIFAVTDKSRITPPDQVMAERRREYGLSEYTVCPGPGETYTLVFSGTPREIEIEEPIAFAVTGKTDLPWADRDQPWDAAAASDRVFAWSDGEPRKIAQAYLYRDPTADAKTKAAYSLPFADVINDRLQAVYEGVVHAVGRLNQTAIPPAEKTKVKSKLRELYRSAAAAFDDESITAPDAITGGRKQPTSKEKNMAETPPPAPQEQETPDDNEDVDQATVDAVIKQITPQIQELVKTAVDEAMAAGGAAEEAQRQMSRLSRYV